jgi:hypothetical protein
VCNFIVLILLSFELKKISKCASAKEQRQRCTHPRIPQGFHKNRTGNMGDGGVSIPTSGLSGGSLAGP